MKIALSGKLMWFFDIKLLNIHNDDIVALKVATCIYMLENVKHVKEWWNCADIFLRFLLVKEFEFFSLVKRIYLSSDSEICSVKFHFIIWTTFSSNVINIHINCVLLLHAKYVFAKEFLIFFFSDMMSL